MWRAMGRKAEVKKTSTTMADRGGETVERMGPRRWSASRILSNWRKKGSLEESGSEGGRGNSRRWNDGEEEMKEAIWSASAADANGVGQMKVTAQPREASDSARRRKGKRCPIPAHGRKAT